MAREEIGQRLKSVRKFLNLNQDAVSKKLYITKQTLSRYENENRFPDSKFLQRFGRAFNVNANWLLYGLGDMFLENPEELNTEHSDFKALQFHLKKIEQLFIEIEEKNGTLEL